MKMFNRKPTAATLHWVVVGRVPDSEETVVVARFDQEEAAKKFFSELVGPTIPEEEKGDWYLANILTKETYYFEGFQI